MQINYEKLGTVKNTFMTSASIVGGAIGAHVAMNVIPGIIMNQAYTTTAAATTASLGPLAPYFPGLINTTARIASAEAYTQLKNTGCFGWTISACTKAVSAGALTGTVLAHSLCKTLALAHTACTKKSYQLSVSKGKSSSMLEERDLEDDCVYISHAARIRDEANHAQDQGIAVAA